ncbi:MAG TPA: hypothetical protein VGD71_09920 [Kribbella sp.]
MLTLPLAALAVEYRFIPAFRAYAVSDQVERADIDKWCESTFGLLGEIAAVAGITATAGATYGDGFLPRTSGRWSPSSRLCLTNRRWTGWSCWTCRPATSR